MYGNSYDPSEKPENYSIDQKQEFIKDFRLDDCKLGSQGYKRILLQLFGMPGNGKSSFINSCKFVLEGGEYSNIAEAAASSGGQTLKRVPYKLTDAITIVDNRGMPKLADHETGQIFAQLGNLLPINKEVEWCKDYEENVDRLMDESKNPNYSDFIVPIFVHSVFCKIPQYEVSRYKTMLDNAHKLTGIPPIILLTHMSAGGLTAMRSCFEDMGIKEEKIYSVENYTENDNESLLEKHEEILNFLCQVLKNVEIAMRVKRNPQSERNDCLKLVLKHIGKREKIPPRVSLSPEPSSPSPPSSRSPPSSSFLEYSESPQTESPPPTPPPKQTPPKSWTCMIQ